MFRIFSLIMVALTLSLSAENYCGNDCKCKKRAVENCFHVLERLTVALPENGDWSCIHSEEPGMGNVFEIWQKAEGGDRLVIVTSPYVGEERASAEEFLATLQCACTGCSVGKEVVRHERAHGEVVAAFQAEEQWTFVRVIPTSYALHVATYALESKSIDPETYFRFLDESCTLVY